MNERIKELAKLADHEFTGNEGYGAGDCLVGLAAVEKFAELIVRECLNTVGHYANVDEGIAVAKKNFGVNE